MPLLQDIAYNLTIRPRMYFLKKLLPEAIIRPTGSRYVCNPPVLTTDVDFLVFSEKSIHGRLLSVGYKEALWINYSWVDDKNFISWRKGNTNLIVTSSLKYAEAFDTATYLCKKHNIRWKLDRAILHEGLRGNLKPLENNLEHTDIPLKVRELVCSCNGQYGHAILKAYRAKQGLEGFHEHSD